MYTLPFITLSIRALHQTHHMAPTSVGSDLGRLGTETGQLQFRFVKKSDFVLHTN